MSAPDASAATDGAVARRRPRPPMIAALRLILPAVAVLTLVAIIGAAATNAFHAASLKAAASKPIELIGPRLTGEDNKQRPFVITATTAERQPGTTKIRLKAPVLVRAQGGADQMRVTAQTGLYDEGAGKLELSGDVRLAAPNGNFNTPSAVYDAKTGEVQGASGLKAAGSAGQIQAGSFAVKDKGKSVIYKGGVHTRLNVK